VLVSPNTDRSGQSTTRQSNSPRDPLADDAGDRRLAELALGNLDDDSLHKSPLFADLSRLPPTYVEVGGREVLLGDSKLLAERAARLGADVTLHIEPDGVHLMQAFAPHLSEANESLARVAAFVRRFANPPGN
jgi:acetyl esterase/lipase